MRRFSEFPCLTNDAILLVQSYQDGKMYGQLIHPRTGMPVMVFAPLPKYFEEVLCKLQKL